MDVDTTHFVSELMLLHGETIDMPQETASTGAQMMKSRTTTRESCELALQVQAMFTSDDETDTISASSLYETDYSSLLSRALLAFST